MNLKSPWMYLFIFELFEFWNFFSVQFKELNYLLPLAFEILTSGGGYVLHTPIEYISC